MLKNTEKFGEMQGKLEKGGKKLEKSCINFFKKEKMCMTFAYHQITTYDMT